MAKGLERITGRETSREMREKLNALIEAAQAWQNISVGPGLTLKRHAGGVLLNVRPALQPSRRAGTQDCSGGSTQTMGNTIATQDTDDWASETDDCPVELDLLTDVYWNEDTAEIVGRFRTLSFDRCGNCTEISAESDEVVLIETEACT